MKVKTFMKSCLLMLALTLLTPQHVMASKNIPVVTKNGNEKSTPFPHRTPIPSNIEVYGVLDNAQSTLTLAFGLGSSDVSISIYKDGAMVYSAFTAVWVGDRFVIDLSNFSAGQYDVVATCDGEEFEGIFDLK